MKLKIIVEQHEDGFVAYPIGLKGIVVAQGDTRDEVMREIKSAIEFHLETFGEEDFNDNFPLLDAFISETEVAIAL